jgi:hypothetical protein
MSAMARLSPVLGVSKPSEINFSVGLDWVEGESHSVLTNDPIVSPEYLLRG